jgi:hypothetical protein
LRVLKEILPETKCVLCAGSLDDAVISPMEGIPRKKLPGNRTLQIHNGVMRKAMTEDISTLNETYESPTVTKQENSEIKVTDNKDLRTKSQETEEEVIPIVEGSVAIIKIKGTMMEKPSVNPSTLKEGSNVTSLNSKDSNADNKRENDTLSKASGDFVPENIQNEADKEIKENSKPLPASTIGIASISEIHFPEKVHMENDDRGSTRPKTQSSYMSNKKQSIKNDEEIHLGEETITKFFAVDGIRKDITHTKQDTQEHNLESPEGIVNDLDGNVSHNINGTLIKKIGEKDVLFIGSAEDFTENPLNFKTNTYKDRYRTQATPGLNSNFWNIGSRTTPIPNTKPTSLNVPGARSNYTGTELTSEHFKGSFIHTAKPPHIQTDEPWRPILPYYTKHSPKPDDDDTGTGEAEVVVVPPSALENQKTNEDQYHDNTYSSRLGQPAPNHKLHETLSGM